MNISTVDIVVFSSYCLLILFIGLYVSREKKGKEKSAEDYFLAGKSLPWWAIGAVSYTHLTLPTKRIV